MAFLFRHEMIRHSYSQRSMFAVGAAARFFHGFASSRASVVATCFVLMSATLSERLGLGPALRGVRVRGVSVHVPCDNLPVESCAASAQSGASL